MPTELAEALAGITPCGGMGLPCPALAAGCVAAYVCELPSEPLPQFCRAAGRDRAPGCYAAADAVCGPTRGQKCEAVLDNLKYEVMKASVQQSCAGFRPYPQGQGFRSPDFHGIMPSQSLRKRLSIASLETKSASRTKSTVGGRYPRRRRGRYPHVVRTNRGKINLGGGGGG